MIHKLFDGVDEDGISDVGSTKEIQKSQAIVACHEHEIAIDFDINAMSYLRVGL
jgi:hypothetical protein